MIDPQGIRSVQGQGVSTGTETLAKVSSTVGVVFGVMCADLLLVSLISFYCRLESVSERLLLGAPLVISCFRLYE